MESSNYIFPISDKQYQVTLLHKGYNDPLNRCFNFYFSVSQIGNQSKTIIIGITDRVLHMWGISDETVNEKLFNFCLQIFPAILKDDLLMSGGKTNILFHRDDNVQQEVGVLLIKAEANLDETAKKYIFSSSQPTNTQIRIQIIRACYAEWLINPHGFTMKTELLRLIPVTEIEIERNLKYLINKGYLDGSLTSGGYIHFRITEYGIDIYENPDEFSRAFSLKVEQTVNVDGDYISPTIIGNGNSLIIKSMIEDSFKNIEIEIEASDIKNKKEVSSTISELKKELLGEEPKPQKIRDFMEDLGKKAKSINDKILSHPILSQLIATALLKTIGV